jgi:hypothetical protein
MDPAAIVVMAAMMTNRSETTIQSHYLRIIKSG